MFVAASLTAASFVGSAAERRFVKADRATGSQQMTASGTTADYSTGDDNAALGHRNVFVNDPCLDPPPPALQRTVQSETEIAVLNFVRDDHDNADDKDDPHGDNHGDPDWDDDWGDNWSDGSDSTNSGSGSSSDDNERNGRRSGRLMVAGYNDSYGADDNRQGLSGFSYSTDGGRRWIDASGLPPRVPGGAPAGTPGQDAYLGHPVVQVHHRTETFFYASLYQNPAGGATVSVNRGQFKVAPQQVPVESFANTRCEQNPEMWPPGKPDPPQFVRERIIWEPPVEAVAPVPGPDGMPRTDDDDIFDRHWLYVNQETGVLYLSYTRLVGATGATPIELVRSFDGGRTWTPPSVIVPNLGDTFNTGTQPIVTPTGRVIVTWFARTFAESGSEVEQRIETAFSDNCSTPAPCVFGPPVIVDRVNPQAEPLGYTGGQATMMNPPYIAVDKGRDDGLITDTERQKPGFGNVYITYFDGRTPFPTPRPEGEPDPSVEPDPVVTIAPAADILLARSTNNGTTYGPPVKVNDDPGDTSHVFPSVQVNKHAEVFVTWIDRRRDRPRNVLNDTWADISRSAGEFFGQDGRLTTVSTDWFTREDRFPDYGEYNSSEVIGFQHFVSIWADGRFPPAPSLTPPPDGTTEAVGPETPDTLFAIVRRGGFSSSSQ
jgi:hypothetical protein